MTFLRLRPEDLSGLPSPALLSLATREHVECPMVRRPDGGDVRNFLGRGPDEELASLVGRFQKAAKDYDLAEAVRQYERIGEIVSERWGSELRGWFRRSKIAQGTLYGGIGLTSALAAALKPDIRWELLLNILLGIEKVHGWTGRISKWLVERWPFAEKGLPFLLWRYGIPPHEGG